MAYKCEMNVKTVSEASLVPENSVRDHIQQGLLDFGDPYSVAIYIVHQRGVREMRKDTGSGLDAFGEVV